MPAIVDLTMLHQPGFDPEARRWLAGLAAALARSGAPVGAFALRPGFPRPDLPPPLDGDPRVAPVSTATVRRLARDGPPLLQVAVPLDGSPFGPAATPYDAAAAEHLVACGAPLVASVHVDTHPAVGPDAGVRRAARRCSVLAADHVVVPFEPARTAVEQRWGLDPGRVTVLGLGIAESFWAYAPRAPGAALVAAIGRPFLLTVAEPGSSGDVLGAGVTAALEAFAGLPAARRRDLALVMLAGDGEAAEALRAATAAWTAERGLSPVRVLDPVADDVRAALYRAARLYVLASTGDVAARVALEAAGCGCPVVTLGDVADPIGGRWPVDEEADRLERALADAGLRERRRADGLAAAGRHSWAAVAAACARVHEQVLAARRRLVAVGPLPPRLALVGPFPPNRSGVAEYDRRLAAALAPRCRLVTFADRAAVRPPLAEVLAAGHEYPQLPVSALGRSVDPDGFDAVIYAMGDSPAHLDTYRAALAHPGILWLHDVNLSGLHLSMAHRQPSGAEARAFLRRRLAACYGERADALGLADEDLLDLDTYVRGGIALVGELARASRLVVVGSTLARDLLLADLGTGPRPPVAVVPLAAPTPPLPPPLPPPGAGPPPVAAAHLIGSFGWLHPHRRPEVLIDALALLQASGPTDLVFVGPTADPGLPGDLARRAERLGVGDRVRFTGRIDDDAYWAWLRAVEVAVQLRGATHGESSATVTEALAAGTAVVTAVASAAELPDGVLRLVGPDAPAEAVAMEVGALLADPQARRELGARGRQWAASRTFDRVSDEVLTLVAELVEPRPVRRRPRAEA